MIGLLLPAIQKVREAAARATCLNNFKQTGLALHSFESSHGRFPRAGEHVFYSGGQLRKTQDFQSCLTLILPYIEQENAFRAYDLRYRYDETAGNLAAMSLAVKTYLCPSNPFDEERVGGRSSRGLGCADVMPVPYCEIAPDGTEKAGDAFLMAGALMGSPYPATAYGNVQGDATTAANKRLQLVTRVDPYFGGPTVGVIRDGTSNTIALAERVGGSERQRDVSGGYANPVTGSAYDWWEFACPDTASGVAKRINNNDNDRFTHDSFNNNEIWSAHPDGVNVCFADGSARFVRQSISTVILRAMVTRAGGESYSAD